MRKAGRFTAALLLIAVGAAVITDRYAGTQITGLLIEWWPVLFIALGLEYIFFNSKYGDGGKQLKLDLGGVIFAVLISAVVIGSTQSADSFRNLFGQMKPGGSIGSIMSGEGHKFEKPKVAIDVPASLDRISVINRSSGNVSVKPGSTDQVQVEMVVYVTGDETEAASIAEQTALKQEMNGSKLQLIAEGKEYSFGPWMQKRPAIDIVITVPAQIQVDMDFEMSNGKFKAEQLTFKKDLKVRTTNGEIEVSSLTGNLDLESTNAAIKSLKTKGLLQLETTNGSIEVDSHQGDARIKSTNGRLKTADVTGSIQSETTNGGIVIADALKDVRAHTTNGNVDIVSRNVGGNWDVETSHGRITLKLPSTGDYKVKGNGKRDDIVTSLPLRISKDKIEGSVGSGRNEIKLNTNGSIVIEKAD
ncbi:DUF4097 family beta strand repeat-containing protein [Paenibacillus piri]|uniref:DUF4097 domain-containing protein n=1 Tax=Paenibacillus piri TaxID=2547395 RepID=A0A4R5KHH7_9BACL|nr:DUF4097 family beta strand repeat-containing protein [Paenibacillus piri]TDF94185.1 hypothetical protein E1757_25185 [Paenibacillus piri]